MRVKSPEKDPESGDAQARKEKYESADKALSAREGTRRAKWMPVKSLRVSTIEPEAPIQPQKTGGYAPSYRPSVLANQGRVIVGKAVDPSDESKVVSGMLDEAEAIGESNVQRLLLDGNYFNETILSGALDRNIDLLCLESGERRKKPAKLKKKDFKYNEERDVYVCPAGRELTPRSRDKNGRYVQYECSGNSDCPLRDRCFGAKSTRRVIRRLPIDEAKEALRKVMEQPGAQQAYSKRKAWVEPVFAQMRGRMNIGRCSGAAASRRSVWSLACTPQPTTSAECLPPSRRQRTAVCRRYCA